MLPVLGLLAILGAQGDSLVFSGRDGQLEVVTPKLPEAAIRLDGNLDEPAWQQAAVLSGFTEFEPIEGIAPEDRTEIRVFYTDDAIYFGVRAWDTRPDLIMARLAERDRAVFGDDYVRVMLDTFNDRRQAYVFYVSPLGLQT
ncbi:MAG: carbohydrate binding family 9 domain-containing protein, partial [Gemmatimonadetes bacterium]|nr:carbohydrate binding family 9 domain-containing protein [Gemmatimonadota bacterium]